MLLMRTMTFWPSAADPLGASAPLPAPGDAAGATPAGSTGDGGRSLAREGAAPVAGGGASAATSAGGLGEGDGAAVGGAGSREAGETTATAGAAGGGAVAAGI